MLEIATIVMCLKEKGHINMIVKGILIKKSKYAVIKSVNAKENNKT